MNPGDTFTHNGILFTVTSVPESDTVKARGQKTIVDPDEDSPNTIMQEIICIKESDITP
jgi:hypothetical protein